MQNQGGRFFKKLITSGSGVSSKRFMGMACIIFAMVFACLGFFFDELGKVDGTVSTVLIQFLTAGVALFGVSVLDNKYEDGKVSRRYQMKDGSEEKGDTLE